MAGALRIGGFDVAPGTVQRVELTVARLPTGTSMSVPVHVVHGGHGGPSVWISAAIHGDEVNGIEIIRQVVKSLDPDALHGSVFAVPVVNVFGFISRSRYLPDRRDLNRSFPGSADGSLAAQLAYLFMTEIVARCTHGIDLHTGSLHRTNLPHVRANLDEPETLRCARAFGTQLLVHAQTRDGSLRQAASQLGISCLLYEAGEAHRFDQAAIEAGVAGVLRVLQALEMHNGAPPPDHTGPIEVRKTQWVRARRSGVLRLQVQLGDPVQRRQPLGVIGDAFGDKSSTVRAPFSGVVLGIARHPLVHRGDAVVHLAAHERPEPS